MPASAVAPATARVVLPRFVLKWFMFCSPLFGRHGLAGQPGGYGANVLVAHALGHGPHQVLRVVAALVGLPGPQLALDIAGVLAGDTREVAADAFIAGAVTALAGDDVVVPVAAQGELLAAGQQLILDVAALGLGHPHLAVVERRVG